MVKIAGQFSGLTVACRSCNAFTEDPSVALLLLIRSLRDLYVLDIQRNGTFNQFIPKG